MIEKKYLKNSTNREKLHPKKEYRINELLISNVEKIKHLEEEIPELIGIFDSFMEYIEVLSRSVDCLLKYGFKSKRVRDNIGNLIKNYLHKEIEEDVSDAELEFFLKELINKFFSLFFEWIKSTVEKIKFRYKDDKDLLQRKIDKYKKVVIFSKFELLFIKLIRIAFDAFIDGMYKRKILSQEGYKLIYQNSTHPIKDFFTVELNLDNLYDFGIFLNDDFTMPRLKLNGGFYRDFSFRYIDFSKIGFNSFIRCLDLRSFSLYIPINIDGKLVESIEIKNLKTLFRNSNLMSLLLKIDNVSLKKIPFKYISSVNSVADIENNRKLSEWFGFKNRSGELIEVII